MFGVSVRNPNCLTEAELQLIANAITNEQSEDEVGGTEDKESSEDEVINESEHDSLSEIEVSDEERFESDGSLEGSESVSECSDQDENIFVGRDKTTVWHKNPLVSKFSKANRKNIIKIFPGLKQNSTNISDELSAFQIYFPDDIIEHIALCTNIFIETIQGNFDRVRDARKTSKNEILALMGLLFISGVKKQNHTNFLELWTNDGSGIEIFRACMSYKRFLFLLSALRFDDKRTRHERQTSDKLAPVTFMIDNFVSKCKENFCLGETLTIDEMLIPFRGRCSFIQYIPNKPAKYGLKMFVVCDSKTFYVSNLELYCGVQPEGPYKQSNTPKDIVHRLVQPWKGHNRNLTCDNWYSSYPLATSLLKDKMTMVGTLKKNKREIPSDLLPNKTKPARSSIFAFQKDVTLVSFVPKRYKAVVLISTMHSDANVDEETQKPEIILFYNSTKGAVDCVDQMCSNYSVSRRTNRWPLCIFFQLLNIAGINGQILYNAKNIENPCMYRRIFLKNLGMSLMKLHLSERAQIQSLPSDIKAILLKYKHQEYQEEEPPAKKKSGRCVFCTRKRNKNTTIRCSRCQKLACSEHVTKTILCIECNNQSDDQSD